MEWHLLNSLLVLYHEPFLKKRYRNLPIVAIQMSQFIFLEKHVKQGAAGSFIIVFSCPAMNLYRVQLEEEENCVCSAFELPWDCWYMVKLKEKYCLGFRVLARPSDGVMSENFAGVAYVCRAWECSGSSNHQGQAHWDPTRYVFCSSSNSGSTCIFWIYFCVSNSFFRYLAEYAKMSRPGRM